MRSKLTKANTDRSNFRNNALAFVEELDEPPTERVQAEPPVNGCQGHPMNIEVARIRRRHVLVQCSRRVHHLLCAQQASHPSAQTHRHTHARSDSCGGLRVHLFLVFFRWSVRTEVLAVVEFIDAGNDALCNKLKWMLTPTHTNITHPQTDYHSEQPALTTYLHDQRMRSWEPDSAGHVAHDLGQVEVLAVPRFGDFFASVLGGLSPCNARITS